MVLLYREVQPAAASYAAGPRLRHGAAVQRAARPQGLLQPGQHRAQDGRRRPDPAVLHAQHGDQPGRAGHAQRLVPPTGAAVTPASAPAPGAPDTVASGVRQRRVAASREFDATRKQCALVASHPARQAIGPIPSERGRRIVRRLRYRYQRTAGRAGRGPRRRLPDGGGRAAALPAGAARRRRRLRPHRPPAAGLHPGPRRPGDRHEPPDHPRPAARPGRPRRARPGRPRRPPHRQLPGGAERPGAAGARRLRPRLRGRPAHGRDQRCSRPGDPSTPWTRRWSLRPPAPAWPCTRRRTTT